MDVENGRLDAVVSTADDIHVRAIQVSTKEAFMIGFRRNKVMGLRN